MTAELLRLEDVHKSFKAAGGRTVRAVDGVDLSLPRGETMGVVGESGCGKSTLARAVLMLQRPDAGRVIFGGEDVTGLRGGALRRHRRRATMVFQDPNDSLDPRFTVARTVTEPLRAAGLRRGEAMERAAEALRRVGLEADALALQPYQFSGGQRQRIGIARALVTGPELVVLDEPTSALDVSVQAQILNLLLELQREESLTYLFISHNLAVVRHLSHRVAVMYLGRVVETGPAAEVFARPRHPYTLALLSAVPDPDQAARERIVLQGDLPSPTQAYAGCSFASRCPLADAVCRTERPPLREAPGGPDTRLTACHHAADVPAPALV